MIEVNLKEWKEDIETKIAEVKRLADSGDNEAAHSAEDFLYESFVRFISVLNGQVSEVAKEILKTKDFKFARWCS